MGNNILKPVTSIEDNIFVLKSHITSSNSRVLLNKEEAALLYADLHKFLFPDGKTKNPRPKTKLVVETYRISTCMGKLTNFFGEQLHFLTKEQRNEFDTIGFTGKNSKGKKVSRLQYLNSLKIGKFNADQTRYDNGDFCEEFVISRAYRKII